MKRSERETMKSGENSPTTQHDNVLARGYEKKNFAYDDERAQVIKFYDFFFSYYLFNFVFQSLSSGRSAEITIRTQEKIHFKCFIEYF